MSESVGKISLDIDLQSGLDKHIKQTGNLIGKQLGAAVEGTLKKQMNGMKAIMPKFQMPKKAFTMPKKTYSEAKTADVDTDASKAQIESLNSVLDNTNAKIDIQKQKLADLKSQLNAGLTDGVKSEIEQLERVMQSSEGRIQVLTNNLKDLKHSYEVAVSPERKNKILDEISKTETQMSSLMNRSDKALQKIIQLEDGMSGTKKNALHEKIVNTEASLLQLNKRADQTKSKMSQLADGMNNAGRNANKSEQPMRRLGGTLGRTEKAARRTGNSFLFAGRQGNSMGNSIQRALTRILKQVFVFTLLYKAIRGFTSYVGSALRTNDQFMHSLNQVRTNLQVAFMPIYQAILPALNALMSALATVTAYIASFVSAIFGKTYKQSYQAAQGLNTARAAMEGYGAASKKAAKSAKEAKKASLGLAGFDEINSLNFSDDDDAGADGGAGGGGGGGGGIPPLVAPDFDTSLIDGKMAELVGNIKKLLEPTIESLKNLWTAMDPFKAFVAQGAVDFFNNFLKPVGLWTFGEGIPRFIDALAYGFGAVNWPGINDALNRLWEVLTLFTIGIGEGLLWFWEKVLIPLGAWTISNVVPAFLDILSGAINIVNNAIVRLMPIASWLFENFLKPLADWTGGVILSALDLLVAALRRISDWIQENEALFQNIILVLGSFALAWGIVVGAVKTWGIIAGIATAISAGLNAAIAALTTPIGLTVLAIGALIATGVSLYKNWDEISARGKKIFSGIYKDIVKPAVDLIMKIIKDMIDIVTKWWVTWGADLVKGVKDALGNIGKLFTNLWINVLQPLIKTMLDTMTKLWDKHLKGLVQDIADFIGKLIKAALDIFNKFIMPIVNFLVQALGPAFTKTFSEILKVVEWAVGLVSGVLKGLIKALGGVIDFIAGVFTGNWKKAWNGIKTFMSGIADSLVAIFKGAINLIVNAFNSMIGALNKIKVNVPDWVPGMGGKSFGINIPKIPRLAKGGLVSAPTLAMVGDNRGASVDPEVVSPLSKLQDMIGGNNEGMIEVLRMILLAIEQLKDQSGGDVVLKLSELELGRAAAKGINKAQRIAGKQILDI